jgi:hypothetical protein
MYSCKQVIVNQGECVMPDEIESMEIVKNKNSESDQDSEQDEQEPRLCTMIPQEKDANLDTNVTLINFSDKQKEKMHKAITRIKIAINSVEFKKRVLAHTYKGETTFVQNDGLTNEEIYYIIMDAAEELSPQVDNELDLEIQMYYSRKRVVGYTYPNVTKIWVNSKYFNTNSLAAVAANVVHEWTHKLGFGHDYKSTSRRPYSVPYGVGTIIKEIIEQM